MDLQQVPLFYERHEFRGQFIRDSIVTDPVDVIVEFNKLEGGRIDGIVRDGASSGEVVQQVFEAREPWRLVSVGDPNHTLEIGDVLISRLPPRSSRPAEVIAELSCGTVSETQFFKARTKRGVSFRLAGALGILEPRDSIHLDRTGNHTVDRTVTELDLGDAWPGTVELRNEYLWEESAEPSHGCYAHVPTLHLECEVSADELSDDTLIADAKALANDATLLMSFARRQWIAWYAYEFWTHESVARHRIHSSRDTSGRKRPIWDSPVGLKANEFITVGFAGLRHRRDNGQDLRLAIAYSIPKAGSRYVEERFGSVFWALEKLIELFMRANRRDQILGGSAFNRLSRHVRQVCEEARIPESPWGHAPVTKRMIQDKLPELNRPTIGTQLKWVCDLLDVTWRDLYPASYDSAVPRFIKTRNDIFHSNATLDSTMVLRETYRVSLLFERLILKTLGWSNMDNTSPRATGLAINDEV